MAGPLLLALALLVLLVTISSPSRSVVGEEPLRGAIAVGIVIAIGTALTARFLLLTSKYRSLIIGAAIGLIGWWIAYGLLTFS